MCDDYHRLVIYIIVIILDDVLEEQYYILYISDMVHTRRQKSTKLA